VSGQLAADPHVALASLEAVDGADVVQSATRHVVAGRRVRARHHPTDQLTGVTSYGVTSSPSWTAAVWRASVVINDRAIYTLLISLYTAITFEGGGRLIITFPNLNRYGRKLERKYDGRQRDITQKNGENRPRVSAKRRQNVFCFLSVSPMQLCGAFWPLILDGRAGFSWWGAWGPAHLGLLSGRM